MKEDNTLFELTRTWAELLNMAQNAETEEDIKMYSDTLESIDALINDKLEGCCHVLEKLNGKIKLLNDEIKARQDKVKTMKNNIVKLKEYMMKCMTMADLRRCEAGTFNVSIATNGGKQGVNVLVDVDKIPPCLDAVKVTYEADKNKLRELCEAYAKENDSEPYLEVDGVRIAELEPRGESLRIK